MEGVVGAVEVMGIRDTVMEAAAVEDTKGKRKDHRE